MNTTIKTLAFATVSSFIFMGGCVSDLTTVTFDHTAEKTIETQAFTTTGTQTFGESILTSSIDAELKSKNTTSDLLDELKLKSARITNEDTLGNFDNIEKIELYIQADGQPEVLMASKNVPDGVRTVDLDVNSSEDLAKYLKATTFTYRIKGTNSGPIPAMKLKVSGTYAGKASVK